MIHRKVYEIDGTLKHMVELSPDEQQMLGDLIDHYRNLELDTVENIHVDSDMVWGFNGGHGYAWMMADFNMPGNQMTGDCDRGADFFVRTLTFMRQLMESYKR